MFTGRNIKTTLIAASNGATLKRRSHTQRNDPNDLERTIARYGTVTPFAQDRPLLENAISHHHTSRHVLKTDGYHLLFVFIYKGTRLIDIRGVQPADRSTLYVLMQDSADYMEFLGGDGVILTGEVWTNEIDPKLNTVDISRRGEALLTAAISSDGKAKALLSRITRSDFGIQLDDPKETPATPRTLLILLPFIEAMSKTSPITPQS